MDEEKRLKIANFRYGLIAPIVCRKLDKGEQARVLAEIAASKYHDLKGNPFRPGLRTLERYLAAYRKKGLEGLKPQVREDKRIPRAIPENLLPKALELKKELPARSVEQIIRILELSQLAEPGTLKRTTVGRYLKEVAQEIKAEPSAHRRFSYSKRNQCWQGDTHATLYLPHPTEPGKKKSVRLVAFIDDYSRYIPHAEYYFDEKLPRLEDCLKKAILRCGVPEKLYVDNGSIYRSHHLARICGELSIHLIHSRPYKPQGRGKVEVFFRYLDKSFRPEAQAIIEQGKLKTLEDLNNFFWAWLEMAYQQKKHSSTAVKPVNRFNNCTHPLRRVDIATLNQIFLWQEERTVDKTCCFSLEGNTYEVDSILAGKRIIVKYDPFDLTRIQVWFSGKQYSDAKILDLSKPRHPKVPKEDRIESTTPTSGLNYLELLKKAYDENLTKTLGDLAYTRLGTPAQEGDAQ